MLNPLSTRNKVHDDPSQSGEDSVGMLLPKDLLHHISESEIVMMEGTLLKKQAFRQLPVSNQPQETQNTSLWKPYRVVLTGEALYFLDAESQKESKAALDKIRLVDVNRHGGVFTVDEPTVQRLPTLTPSGSHDSLVGMAALHEAAETKSVDKSLCFDIKTKERGGKSGRVYHLCVPADSASTDRRDKWVKAIVPAVNDAHRELHANKNLALQAQGKLRAIVIHPFFTAITALLIFANFVCNCIEAEWNSEEHEMLFEILDATFTSVFALEITLRFLGLGPRAYFRDRWNTIDILCVFNVAIFIAPLTAHSSDVGKLTSLRVLRLLRIVRVIQHFSSLQVTVNAVFDALFPLAEAMLILFVVMSVWAILGVSFFREATERFRAFSAGFFTMLQVVTGDSWHLVALAMSTPFYDEEGNRLMVFDSGAAIFLGTFIMFGGWIVLNVVVAVMLEAFLASSSKSKLEKQQNDTRRILRNEPKTVTTIGPVLDLLLQFKNKKHLNELIELLFCAMDVNGNGLLDFNSLYEGFQNLKVPVILDKDTWYSISNGQMDDITLPNFTDCMKHQLKVYTETILADELISATLNEDSSRSKLLALKLLMQNTSFEAHSSVSSLADAVHGIRECMASRNARMERIEKALNISILDDDEIRVAPFPKKHRQNRKAKETIPQQDPDSGHGDVGAHAARVEEVPRRHNRQGAVDGQKEDADQPVEEIYKDGFTPNAKKERRRRSKRREEEGICN